MKKTFEEPKVEILKVMDVVANELEPVPTDEVIPELPF